MIDCFIKHSSKSRGTNYAAMATLFAQQVMIHTNCNEVIRLAVAPPCLPPVLGGGSFYFLFSIGGFPPAFASSIPYAWADYTLYTRDTYRVLLSRDTSIRI